MVVEAFLLFRYEVGFQWKCFVFVDNAVVYWINVNWNRTENFPRP